MAEENRQIKNLTT